VDGCSIERTSVPAGGSPAQEQAVIVERVTERCRQIGLGKKKLEEVLSCKRGHRILILNRCFAL